MAAAYRHRCRNQPKRTHRQPPSTPPRPGSHHRHPSRRGQIPIAPAAPSLPTSRGFLPWRLSDAGPARVERSRWPASETLHRSRHQKNGTNASSSPIFNLRQGRVSWTKGCRRQHDETGAAAELHVLGNTALRIEGQLLPPPGGTRIISTGVTLTGGPAPH